MKKVLFTFVSLLIVFELTITAAFSFDRLRFGSVLSSISTETKENQFPQFEFPVSISFYRPPDKFNQKVFDETDEVKTALAGYISFKKLTKFSGLSTEVKKNLRNDFLPELGSPAIIEGQLRSQHLNLLIERLLALHKVSDQCEIVIVRSRVPSVLTWKLTFITFTDAVIDVLNDEEIIALAAHELGHLYHADELADARFAGDNRKARIIELKADIVALETLDMLGIERINLLSGVEKLIKARTSIGLKSITEMSPSLADRARLIIEYKTTAQNIRL